MRFMAMMCAVLLWAGCACAAPLKTAIFAGGNFWSMQAVFDAAPGVHHTVAGYTGGVLVNPTYVKVAKGDTGHRLAVLVAYDPDKTTYERLLYVYWHAIDPLDAGGQFCDRGPQFTSAIYAADEGQRRAAEDSKMLLEADNTNISAENIVTVVARAGPFFPAEDYHQSYYKKNPLRFAFYSRNCGRAQRLYEIWGALKR